MPPPKNKGTNQQSRGQIRVSETEADYDDKIRLLEATFQAKLDALYKVIDQKDAVIGRLNIEIGELKQGYNFLSKETTEIKKSVVDNAEAIKCRVDQTDEKIKDVKMKTVDLEDRSRRCNLVFFNFPEQSRFATEDCEETVENLLISLGIFSPDVEIWIDRAHRLGRRRPEHDTKPRPIIVKFSYYKQKEKILQCGAKFRNTHINMSEDFSKETLLVHNQLRKLGKDAKESLYNDPNKAIKYYKVTYRRLAVTYSVNKNDPNARTFTRSFSLDDINGRQNWFVPPEGFTHVAPREQA